MVVKDNANSNIFNIYVKYIGGLNNVHEPRNAEFTAFLGSFLVE